MKFNIDQYKALLIEKCQHNCKCKIMGSDIYCSDVWSCSCDSSVETLAPCTAIVKKGNQSLGSAREQRKKWRLAHLCINPCCTCFLNTVCTLGLPSQKEARKSSEKGNESEVKGRKWLPYEEWLSKQVFFSLKKRMGGEGALRGDGLSTTSSKTVQWANGQQVQSKLQEMHCPVMLIKLW